MSIQVQVAEPFDLDLAVKALGQPPERSWTRKSAYSWGYHGHGAQAPMQGCCKKGGRHACLIFSQNPKAIVQKASKNLDWLWRPCCMWATFDPCDAAIKQQTISTLTQEHTFLCLPVLKDQTWILSPTIKRNSPPLCT